LCGQNQSKNKHFITKYLNDRGKLLKTFNCDIFWVALMNDPQFLKVLMKTVISDAGSNGRYVRYAGILRVGSKPAVPKKGYANIYFVDDGSLNWNCCIVEYRRKKSSNPVIIWYDPSDEMRPCMKRFDQAAKDSVILQLQKVVNATVLDLKTPSRAQQFCSRHPAQDIFSLTWCAMFSAMYINNAFNAYAKIDFVRWQTQPLKMWTRCITSRLPQDWMNKLRNPQYRQFFSHCRRVIGDTNQAVVEKLPDIERIKGKRAPCVYSVLTHYLSLPSLYHP
jgi:hypothetical protein